ncbi:MAG: AMP-binding enzyme, partial [Flammeovirgaceae bacterium]
MSIHVLIAYVTTSEGYVRQDLELYLKQHLAEYMLPRMIVELDSIPLAVTGKVNKRALPKVS